MDLEVLNARLGTIGYQSFVRDGSLVLPLPLFCSVIVMTEADRCIITAMFGRLTRTRATWASVFIMAALLLLTLRPPPIGDIRLILVGAAILSGIWDLYRYILTESAMTTIRDILMKEQKSANQAL